MFTITNHFNCTMSKGYCLFRLTFYLSCHVTLRYMSWLVDSFVMDKSLEKTSHVFIVTFPRECFIRRERFEMSTGRFTTACILDHR